MADIDYSDSSEDEQSNNNYNNNNNMNVTNTSNKLNYLNQSQQIKTKNSNNNNPDYVSHNIQSSNQKDSESKPQQTSAWSVYDNVTYSDSDSESDEETRQTPANNECAQRAMQRYPNNESRCTQRTMQRYPIQSNVNSTKGNDMNDMNDKFNNLHIDNKQEHKQESEANTYPKLFHMRFKENAWNPWHRQNLKDKRAYLVINK
eukprot:UN08507